MGEMRTMLMPSTAHELLLDSQLGATAETLAETTEQLISLRDIRAGEDRRMRVDDLRTAIERARGELAALDALLEAGVADASA